MSYTRNDKTRFDENYNDAFGRLRISDVATMFEAKHKYGIEDYFVDTTTGGGSVTFLNNEASHLLQVGTASGDSAIGTSAYPFRYEPGKSQYILLTGTLGPQKAGVVSRIGYFNENNGLFFQMDENGVSVVTRTNTSGTPQDLVIRQNQWNMDKLDGTGPSGITLDPTKIQIFTIDFEWLGAGRVRFGFGIGGQTYYVHEDMNANVESTVYISTPDLPTRYEIRNVAATASNSSMRHTCYAVLSEGGNDPETSHIRSISTDGASASISPVTVNTTAWQPILSFKLKNTINSVPVSSYAYFVALNMMVTDTNPVSYRIINNPTLTGASFSDHPDVGSVMQYDVNATSYTGGGLSYQGFINGASGAGGSRGTVSDVRERDMVIRPNRTYTIAARAIGSASNILIAANWIEVY